MEFESFIKNLNESEIDNYNKYSEIRGEIPYKIVFECLKKLDENISFKDINSFIRLDKALKDILYKYLGTLEDYIKTKIFSSYDFESYDSLKEKYIYLNRLPKVIKKQINKYEITELYKRFALNFGDIISFLKDYEPNMFNFYKLENVLKLRNNVMHHNLLLFKFDDDIITSTKNEIGEQIESLLQLLPESHREGLIKELSIPINATKENINPKFYQYLLYKEDLLCVNI